MSTRITIKQGEANTVVSAILRDESGPVDLSNVIDLRLIARQRRVKVQKIYATMTPDPNQITNKGKATAVLSAADIDTAGFYQMEIRATWAGGVVHRFPNTENDELVIIPMVEGA